MKLAFYRVKNSLGYERHTFDSIYDQPKEIERMLDKLQDDEVKVYDTSTYGYGGTQPAPNMADFETDFNDEELDNGWWCVVIHD